jgi:hypothetical protein
MPDDSSSFPSHAPPSSSHMPAENPLYQEQRTSLGITILLGLASSLLAMVLITQLIYGPLGTKPAPTWFLASLTALFALVTVNFRHITLTLTEEKVEVRYGVFRTTRRWGQVIACEMDEKHNFYGWGLRFGKYKCQWVWVYNVIGGPRVVFLTEKNKPRGLLVSTRNPEEVVRIASARIQAGGSGGDTT